MSILKVNKVEHTSTTDGGFSISGTGLVTFETAWNDLRTKRTQLLTETDYLALSDATLSEDMRTYRQALRDLPANTSDPTNPTWPVKPS